MSFSQKENIDMLWEILLDELNVNINNKPLMTSIRKLFLANISETNTNMNTNKMSLMDLNQRCLSNTLSVIKELYPQLMEEKRSIKILEEEYKEALDDFTKLSKPKSPPPVNFLDQIEEINISSDVLMEKMLQERSREIVSVPVFTEKKVSFVEENVSTIFNKLHRIKEQEESVVLKKSLDKYEQQTSSYLPEVTQEVISREIFEQNIKPTISISANDDLIRRMDALDAKMDAIRNHLEEILSTMRLNYI